ncbi:glycoside hydrolase family 78 protein [Streptomyces brasiliensis]|uniref:Uncharacterized protein n=1 Tax=Streptomyces brasiliensis TaxID=1954 RepID=A0A917LCA1_9ACTN|nr:hypothetical protein [Streptomyces brasiliensis]GGJ59801.1 hypothetical protein GCM10010121_083050 [Streptomyces brasiliensis]
MGAHDTDREASCARRHVLAFLLGTTTLSVGAMPADAAAPRGHVLAPVHLEADGLAAPLGIDSTTPDLSWEFAPGARNTVQTANQIKAATNLGSLNSAKPDLWDTGQVESLVNHGEASP